jgi:hypothetical protein
MSSYAIPKEKAITSTSGNIAHTAVHVQKCGGNPRRHHWPALVATNAWLKIVGTGSGTVQVGCGSVQKVRRSRARRVPSLALFRNCHLQS